MSGPCGEKGTKFFFSARDVSFHGAERPVKEPGGLLVREPLLIADVQRELLLGRELAQRVSEILAQIRCGVPDSVLASGDFSSLGSASKVRRRRALRQ